MASKTVSSSKMAYGKTNSKYKMGKTPKGRIKRVNPNEQEDCRTQFEKECLDLDD